MATSEEIFAQLEILVHAFPGKEKSKETFAIYIDEHLCITQAHVRS